MRVPAGSAGGYCRTCTCRRGALRRAAATPTPPTTPASAAPAPAPATLILQELQRPRKTGEVAGYASVGVTILGGYMGVRVRPPNVFLVGVRTVRASVNHVAVWH